MYMCGKEGMRMVVVIGGGAFELLPTISTSTFYSVKQKISNDLCLSSAKPPFSLHSWTS